MLTDGHVADASVSMLSHVRRPLECLHELVKAGLLERVNNGYQIHDYLDFNESAETVKRRRESDRKRKASSRNPAGIQAESDRIPSDPSRARASHPIPSPISSLGEQAKEREPASSNGNGYASLSPAAPKYSDPGKDPFTDPVVTQRAGAFVERYQVLYPEHRKGARYAVKPVRDYAAAVTLCQTWPDERLEKLAICFLTTDHKFAEEGSRTIPQFLAIASWCDGKLSEWEKAH